MRGDQRGITFAELLVVITLLLILGGVAASSTFGLIEAYRLRVAVWEFVGDLRLARQRAVSTQVRHRICLFDCSISIPGAAYILEREGNPLDPSSWSPDVARTDLAEGVVITTNVAGGKITFNTKGEPSGSLGSTSTLANGSGIYQVTVASTGRVRVCRGTC